ncbi:MULTISPECIES: Rossmann-like and DUF2520 domain-containing protein [Legionella]|uniref:Rossmann-like domain protein n=1 Tax=Legionella drozanskii LLAP-1 TaxID=1212489 RepID=A0A0W0SQH4_9GAMM|nr:MULTISPECIES: Rossmann-like and DUF2520 domain-containing protein [Legionella]KTC85484.1 Rossmann-like domain protein [Legionella drozanskii LLAP-1]PJE18145.1 MAG: DUF2520 domain-containing protein [Legionella sp.]
MLNINFIGCGNLGKTLGRLITQAQVGTVKGVLTKSQETADAAVEFIGAGKSYLKLNELPRAEIYFITTPDDLIEATCKQLLAEARIETGAIFIHCSGSLSAKVFQRARDQSCYAMSVHPIKSFANPELSAKSFSGTYCGYEGDLDVFPVIKALFEGIGAHLFPIKKEQKMIYHAAGVLANNYLVTLHHIASECYQLAGLREDLAYKITSMLMNDALQNLQNSSHEKALTGPLQRGDISIIEEHLSQLIIKPIIKEAYAVLGEATLSITKHKKELKQVLAALLRKEDGK